MDKYYIPQNLDAPFKIAMFTIFDLTVTLIPFFVIAFLFHKQIVAFLVSVGIYFVLRRIKGDEDHHFTVSFWFAQYFKEYFHLRLPETKLLDLLKRPLRPNQP